MDDPGRRRGQSDAARDPRACTDVRSPTLSKHIRIRHDCHPASSAVVGRPTRGLPVVRRSRRVFPIIPVYDTTAFRRASRSSSVRHEAFRSTAAVAELFRTFSTCHDDLSNSSVYFYTTRLRSGEHGGQRPSDTRSSGRLPHSPSVSEHFRIRHAGRPATNVHVRWRAGEDRAVSRRPPRGTARARSAELEDFSAGTKRGPRPPYSIETIPFLGRFLARSKSGPTTAAKIPQPLPGSLYVVGCRISASDMLG